MQKSTLKIKDLSIITPVILAPMAGISNLPYRRIMKSFGAGLVFSEMVSANGLIREGRKTRQLLCSHEDETPLGIQLFGDDPQVIAQAARMVAEEAALLDINMGCPVKKVIRSGAGSALLKSPEKIGEILSAVRKAYPGPLTIKIRSGWDVNSLNFVDIGRIAANEGVDAITLHPRSRSQGFSGKAHWQHIKKLKESINIPVFGSGDIFFPEDALEMISDTGCDAIMIGRGGYGNPWLIQHINELLNKRPLTPVLPMEKYRVAMKHLDYYRQMFGERKTMLDMRKHLCWYARGLSGASHFRSALQRTETLKAVMELTENFFHQATEAA